MAIPNAQDIMLPLLRVMEDGKERSSQEIAEHISTVFNLSSEEKASLLPSGQQRTIVNRTSWAKVYLKKAGLLEMPKRNQCKITALGLEALRANPSRIDIEFLKQYPLFLEFRRCEKYPGGTEASDEGLEASERTPQEWMEISYQRIQADLAQEILESVKQCSPGFFERLVVRLLLKMGYGGSLADAGNAVGKSGDGGIDGIIKEDKLGLDVIYLQAKRWENNVGSGEVRNFVGSLVGHKASKGVIITTSGFTKDAYDFVKTIDRKVILIDGEKMAQLMIEHDVGVSTSMNYAVKRIDSDFFADE